MTAPFDVYRDPESRKLMLEFVMISRMIDASRAVTELRALNHIGLAHVYADAVVEASQAKWERLGNYDPCAIGRS